MKSRASFKSHPIHPILVSFPLAFFTGAFVFDTIGYFFGKQELWSVSYYLLIAGIAGGLMAAVPGIIDYINTIPPDSSAKKRGAKHGLINTSNILLFAGLFYYRRSFDEDMRIVIALETLGVVMLAVAGWLGGTLVYRNQIGVDPRYANAGKWKEIHIDSKLEWVAVEGASELTLNQMMLVHLNGTRIVIGRAENGLRAFSDRCTHKGGSLAGGSMICGTVQCPWHGAQFDVTSGAVKTGPAKEKIETYTIEEREGKVYVQNLAYRRP